MIATGVRPRPVAPTGEELLVAGLAIATVAATSWAIMAGGWADGTGVALVTAAVAVLEAALLARASVGRGVALLTAPVLGITVVVFLTLGTMPPDGGRGLGHVAGRFAGAIGGGLFDTADWPFDVGLAGVMWAVGFWAGWLVARERRGILALIPCYTALAVNALNAPAPGGVALPQTVAIGLSLLLIARVHLAALTERWRVHRVIALPGTERRFGRVAGVAAAGVLLLSVLVPPLSNRDYSGFLAGLGDAISGKGSGHGPGTGPGAGGTGQGRIAFSPDVDAGGALVSDPQPVLTYTSSPEQAIYLRVLNDTAFSHGSWSPGSGTTETSSPGPLPRSADGLPPARTRRLVQVSVSLAGNATGAQDDALFAGEPLSVDSEAVTALGVADPAGSGLETVDSATLSTAAGRVDTTSAASVATAGQLRAAGTDYPAWLPADWSRLAPASAADGLQVNEIASLAHLWTEGARTPYDQATAIESRLRSSEFSYTLTPPATPAGQWPIVFFLTASHQGYCQYYASSMGAMLRALGIPTRLVSGYGPGSAGETRNGREASVHHVTTSDAHVWVEAFFPGYGWIPFEPTPPSPDGLYQPFPRGGAAEVQPSATPAPQAPASPGPSPTPLPGGGAAGAGTAGGGVPPVAVAIGGGGLGGCLLLLLLVWAWLRRPLGLRGAWRRVGLLGWTLGVRRRPTETHSAFAVRVARALPEVAEAGDPARDGVAQRRAAAVAALDVVAVTAGKAGFSRDGLDAEDVARWHQAWQRLCQALPAIAWHRVRRRRRPGLSPRAGRPG